MTRTTGTGSTGSNGAGPATEIKSERPNATVPGSGTMSRKVGGKLADTFAYPPRLLRSDRAAAYLSMSESHFLKLVGQGRLPNSKRLGGITFWDRLSLDAFVDSYEGEEDAARIDDEWSKMLRGTK
jgi:predicted DNA-binding transcriptional regulator AlpA